ncbi:MAG: hypothetical protein IJS52_08700 [Bacilli bacterium]|nr:hypothetical protein [Bacilli bacterium]
MVAIRDIREKDYPEMARIWRDVLDIPVTDECLAETYGRMGKDDRYATFVAESPNIFWIRVDRSSKSFGTL